MKKFLACMLALAALLSLGLSASASEADREETACTIFVSGRPLDLQGLPVPAYREGETVMVPLRRIAEALGYEVGWDAGTGAITVDDCYIQRATLFAGTAAVTFQGHLQIIDMSRETENAAATVIREGHTYVPLEFFREFLNDTAAEGTAIRIAPSMCEIQRDVG